MAGTEEVMLAGLCYTIAGARLHNFQAGNAELRGDSYFLQVDLPMGTPLRTGSRYLPDSLDLHYGTHNNFKYAHVGGIHLVRHAINKQRNMFVSARHLLPYVCSEMCDYRARNDSMYHAALFCESACIHKETHTHTHTHQPLLRKCEWPFSDPRWVELLTKHHSHH